MKHLIIVGARGWGREVYAAAIHTKAYKNGDFDIKGFLDSKTDAFDGLRGDYPPILSAPEDYEIQKDDVFFIAMGDSYWRKHYAELMEAKGATFMSIICDGAYVNPTAKIGDGSFIAGWTTVSDNVTIGKHVMIHGFSTIGHDCEIGDYSSLSAYVFLGGGVRLSEGATMYPKSMVIPHKKVGNNALVAAASVVMRNVADGLHVIGNPAKKMDF